MTESEALRVEATGETVGEAKWLALRELEQLAPGLDKAAVQFEVLSEGERGLLGVGYAPARVAAVADRPAEPAAPGPVFDESELAGLVREVLERVSAEVGVRCHIDVEEDGDRLTASLTGGELGLLIGRHGQTIDALQHILNAIAFRLQGQGHTFVTVDAAGYRERRRAALEAMATRAAERTLAQGEAVHLEPMSSVERRLVHESLKDHPGVVTRSEGDEPHRYVVVEHA